MNRKLASWKPWITIAAVLMLSAFVLAACSAAPTTDIPKPSNSGGTGEAVNLTGDATAGATVFSANCASCHGDQGKGGIPNPGSDDGVVPALNPIDPGLKNADPKIFATNIDPFLEHGSSPEGSNPALQMKPFGDQKLLTPQQIADTIAYVFSLNK